MGTVFVSKDSTTSTAIKAPSVAHLGASFSARSMALAYARLAPETHVALPIVR
jgi:hypothetical protein